MDQRVFPKQRRPVHYLFTKCLQLNGVCRAWSGRCKILFGRKLNDFNFQLAYPPDVTVTDVTPSSRETTVRNCIITRTVQWSNLAGNPAGNHHTVWDRNAHVNGMYRRH